MTFMSPRGMPQPAQMTYAASPGAVFSAPPQQQQQQLAIFEQPQMVYAVAPKAPQPQMQMQQLSVRANPNNLFEGCRLRSEGPIAREELIRQQRLFEGDMESPPMLFPGQFIDLALLQAQQPQMLRELIVEQPVYAAPPQMYAEVPAVTVVEEFMVNGQPTIQYAIEEPTVQYAGRPSVQYAGAPAGSVLVEEVMYGGQPTVQYAAAPAGSVVVDQVLMAQPVPRGRSSVQYAVAPAGSVMVEEVLMAQPAPGSEVIVDPWGAPDLSQGVNRPGTMVMMAPQQGHMVTATPAQQTVLSGRKGTITNALFDMMDSNADGKISRSEFRRGLKGEIIQVGQAGMPMR